MPKTADVGVVVARFQVHRLHDAHREILDTVSRAHSGRMIVVLGLSATKVTRRNPLDFETRKAMISEAYPNATVLYLRDCRDDAEWSRSLDLLIDDAKSQMATVTLYGGRDSFVAHYTGRYPTQELEPRAYVSGTELRGHISRNTKCSEDFRAGVIWATANGYRRPFMAVDVAVTRTTQRCLGCGADQDVRDCGCPAGTGHSYTGELLLVRKPSETLFRFVGGFVEADSLETAARREVREETGVEVGELRYLDSFIVDDWRYRQESDKILSALFRATYMFGQVKPADDVVEARWMRDPHEGVIVPEHRPMLAAYKASLGSGGVK